MDDTTTSGMAGGPSAIPLPRDRSEGLHGAADARTQASPGSAVEGNASLAAKAGQRLTGALDGQKAAAADMVGRLAETVKRSGEQFEGQQDWIASAIGRGAQELNTLAGALRDRDPGDLAAEIGHFARRQPALFLGAAAAAGFVLARIGKLAAADLSRADLPTIPEIARER